VRGHAHRAGQRPSAIELERSDRGAGERWLGTRALEHRVQRGGVDLVKADAVERRAQAGVAALVQRRGRTLERAQQTPPRPGAESLHATQRSARAA
jgi:hypothetical protein